jgi:biotin operon repressor
VSGTVTPPWLLNYSATEWRSDGVRNKQQISNQLEFFRHLIRKEMKKLKDQKASDGESVDALEHFFWGE